MTGDSEIGPRQLERLLDAVVSVTEDLSLAAVLHRVVLAATELVSARYGALGVIGEDDELREFVHIGIEPDQVEAIGKLPRGEGLLGAVIEKPQPVRLADISADPRSVGFPPNHPPMHSFLGVPVMVGEVAFGNLYLTEKEGGGEFTAEDEAVVTALAACAGAAVSHAQANETRSRKWMTALREITGVGGGSEPDVPGRILLTMVEQASQLVAADVALVLQPGTTMPEVQVATDPDLVGASWDQIRRLSGSGASGRIEVALPGPHSDGATLVLWTSNGTFSPTDAELVATLAEQTAVVLETGQVRAELERLEVVEDRERIARELHDTVIQRLFATGMAFQALGQRVDDHAVRARIDELVTQLDETISDIRSTIFSLQSPASQSDLRASLLDVAEETGSALGFAPHVRFAGPIDSAVPPALADHVVAVAREALTNVAKHAGASDATLDVRATDGRVRVCVVDDGHGLPSHRPPEGRGLGNLADRAQRLNGSFTINPAPDGGTEVVWEVPLSGP